MGLMGRPFRTDRQEMGLRGSGASVVEPRWAGPRLDGCGLVMDGWTWALGGRGECWWRLAVGGRDMEIGGSGWAETGESVGSARWGAWTVVGGASVIRMKWPV